MQKRVTVHAERDAMGAYEVFTWDIWPLIPAEQTLHLDTDGLPRPGTLLRPGMILVGKIGYTQRYRPEQMPTALDIHSQDFATLKAHYGDMWQDGSVYVTPETAGEVIAAWMAEDDRGPFAIVEIRNDALLMRL